MSDNKIVRKKGPRFTTKMQKNKTREQKKIKKPQVQKSNPITQHKLTKTTKPKQESISELQTSQKFFFLF